MGGQRSFGTGWLGSRRHVGGEGARPCRQPPKRHDGFAAILLVYGHKVRTSMMADPNPIKTWRIELKGFPTDLASWQQLFNDRAVASVEPSSGRDGQPTYFVCSQRLDDVRDTEAHARAEKLLAQMNGAARLSGRLPAHQPVQMAWLWYVRADGKPEPMKEVSRTIRLGIEWLATAGVPPDAGSSEASPEQRVVKAMIAAGCSDQIALALEHFGRPNWYDMWTAYEIIEEELFCSTARKLGPKGNKKTKPKKRDLLRSCNWVPEDDLKKFAGSCNYHRHGRKRPPICEQNASTDQAHQILARILQGWLDHLG